MKPEVYMHSVVRVNVTFSEEEGTLHRENAVIWCNACERE
jgi:hypothetical protein